MPSALPDSPAPSSARLRLTIAVLCAVVLAVAGLLLRTGEVDAEADRYHLIADELRAGRLAHSPYHPFGIALLGVVTGPLAGDTLRALRLLAALAAGVVVLCSGSLAERVRPGAGVLASLLVAASPIVWWLGTMGGSDMVGAALLLAAVTVVANGRGPVAARRAFAVGALLGFGFSVRYAVALGVPIAAVWALARGTSWRGVLAAATGWTLGFLPHAVLATAATGSPLPQDGWHNLYLELVCDFDLARLVGEHTAGTLPSRDEFVREYWDDVLLSSGPDAATAAQHVLPGMLLGTKWAPPWATLWPLLLAVAGFAAARPLRRGLALLLVPVALVVGTGVLMDHRARLLLPVLPLLLVGPAVAFAAMRSRALRGAALVLALAAPLPLGLQHLQRYLAEEPVDEIAVTRTLHRQLGRPLAVLATFPCLDAHVPVRRLAYLAPAWPTAARTWDEVRTQMQTTGADVFVTGAATSGHVHGLLVGSDVPPDFRVLHADARVLAVERPVLPSPWIAAATIEPPAPRAGEAVTFTIDIAPDAPHAELMGAGVALRGPGGEEVLLDLPPTGDRRCSRTVPGFPAGDWHAVPFVLARSGDAHRGAARTFTVRGT